MKLQTGGFSLNTFLVSKLFVSPFFVSKLLVSKLLVSTMLVSTLLVSTLLVSTLLVSTFLVSTILFLAVAPVYAEDEPMPIISGLVSTTSKKPLAGVQVVLLDQAQNQLASGITNADGEFKFKHNVCRRCTLEVMPALNTRYACALIDNIPGDTNRNFLLSLQRGFTITGRVIGNGRGLKNIALKAISLDENAEGKKVHDGGLARTSRNGSFAMVLTPGHKRIEVLNDHYPELQAKIVQTVDVTADAQIADLVLNKSGAKAD